MSRAPYLVWIITSRIQVLLLRCFYHLRIMVNTSAQSFENAVYLFPYMAHIRRL